MNKIVLAIIAFVVIIGALTYFIIPSIKLNQQLSNYDLSSCDDVKPQYKEDCYSSLAVKYHEPLICKKIAEIRRNRCYQLISWEYEDLSVCDYMTNIKQPSANPDGGFYTKDSCYFYIAEKRLDQNLCNGMEDINIKDSCFRKVALGKNDTSICENEPMNRDYCYKELASQNKNPQLCEPVLDSSYKAECYWKSAGTNLATCDKIDSIPDAHTSIKPQCYKDVAVASKNISMCELVVTDDQLYKDCLYFVQQ